MVSLDKSIYKLAADSGEYHPNMALNGIHLDKTIHSGYNEAHRIYNDLILARLDATFFQRGGNISPTEAVKELKELSKNIRDQLNGGNLLDQINL